MADSAWRAIGADVEIDQRGDVRQIRLSRLERMNAHDAEMTEALISAVSDNRASSAIVITGTGRAFCSVGYLAMLQDHGDE